MNIIITLFYFAIILGVIVLVHEFGHFFFSKLFKVHVYEFSIGMGPKIFGWKRKNDETDYSIRAIPIGGYCSLAGEDVEYDNNSKVPEEKRLNTKKAWQRFLIMFFGAGNNFLLALIVLFSIGLFYGSTTNDAIVSDLVKDNPAEKAGILIGDKIVKINNHKVTSSEDVSLYIQIENKEKPITFTVLRNNKEINIDVKPIKEKVDDQTVYRVGIYSEGKIKHGFLNAVKFSFDKTKSIVKQMIITVKGLFSGGLSLKQLSGPVGIYSIVDKQKNAGIENILYLVALLSVNVGFINLIPLPAFDGGRILFLIIEKIKGSPVNPKVENVIHTIGFGLLLLLMLYITFFDILRLF